MPRVLRIINRFNLGGPTFNVAYLTKYLSSNYETLLVGGEKDQSEDSSEFILESLGLTPIIIPQMKREVDFRNDYIAYKKIKKLIKEFKPDIVHTHASKAGTLGRLAAASMRVPVVVHTFHGHVFHSYFGKVKTQLYKTIERHLATKTNCIIAISEKQKQELTETYKICSPKKIKVLPLGFDLSRFRSDNEEKRKSFRAFYKIQPDEIAIGIVGRLVPIKNHSLFLESIKFLKSNTKKKIRAFIIGDGEERKAIENKALELGLEIGRIEEKQLSHFVTFTSWIKNIDWAYAGLDIVCLTSLNEGTPVSLIEAQAAGRPIVSTNVGGIQDVVGKTSALLTESLAVNEFAENLLKVVEQEELRISMAKAGWDFVKDRFHYTRLVSDMENLYGELLSRANEKKYL